MKSRERLAREAVHTFFTLAGLVYDVTVQTEGHKTEQVSMRLHILKMYT